MPIPPWEIEPSFDDEGPHPLLEPGGLSHTFSNTSSQRTSGSGLSAEDIGVATAILMPMRVNAPPPTTINGSSTPIPTYTGYEHGAPLSDIYEESEATATPKSRRRSPSPEPTSPIDIDRGASVTPTKHSLRHKKRISSLSTSSSGGSDVGDWETFDNSTVLSSRVAADLAQMRREETLDVEETDLASRRASREEEELAALNARADKILENARKRLTHMGDNLKIARNSFIAPNRSPNLGGEHKPVGGLYRSISAAGANKLGKKQGILPIRTSASLQHMRGMSDASVTSQSKSKLSRMPDPRSASAMEYGTNQYSLFPEPTQYQPSPASSRSYNSPLRPLEEEKNSPSTAETTPESVKAPQMRGLGILTAAAVSKENVGSLERSNSRNTATPTHMRSGSTTSIKSAKELKDQLTGLKSRMMELKSQTQADGLKRRSISSARTPSPFSNANPEQWYSSSPAYQENSSPISTGAGIGRADSGSRRNLGANTISMLKQTDGQDGLPITPANTKFLDIDRMTPNTENKLLSSARTDRNTPLLVRTQNQEHGESIDQDVSSVGRRFSRNISEKPDDQDQGEIEHVAENDEEQIYLNEVLEESLREAEVEPEVPPIPEEHLDADGATRHEDRLDAFDYENMFLHSAMGNYTGKSINGSDSGSDVDSDDDGSVETSRMTRTPVDEDDNSTEKDEDSEPLTDDEIEDVIVNGKSPGLTSRLPTSASHQLGSPPRIGLPEPPKSWAHTRSLSMDSVSTSATFETATEGAGDYDETPQEIYNWDPTPSSSLGYSPSSHQSYKSSPSSKHGFSSPHGGGRATPRAAKSPLVTSPLRQNQHFEISYDEQKARGSPGLGLGVTGGENGQFINDNGVPERFQNRQTPTHSRQTSEAILRPESQATVVLASPKGHKRQFSGSRPITPKTVAVGSPVLVTVTSSPQRKIVINRSLQHPPTMPLAHTAQLSAPPTTPLPAPPSSHAALQSQITSPRKSKKIMKQQRPQSIHEHVEGGSNHEILMESLIKLADPNFSLAPGIKFEEIDKNLVLQLLGAVGGVCNDILRASGRQSQDDGKVRVLRQRLHDAALTLYPVNQVQQDEQSQQGYAVNRVQQDERVQQGQSANQFQQGQGPQQFHAVNPAPPGQRLQQAQQQRMMRMKEV